MFMGNAGIPCMPDILQLMANIHVRRRIGDLTEQLHELEQAVTSK